MSIATVFSIANKGIIVFWLLLILAPRWRWTTLLVQSVLVPVVLGLVYTWLICTVFFGGALPEGGNFTTLVGVMLFFSSPIAATAAWIHFLVFDLFLGAWQVRDAQARGIPHLAIVPCLILTLLAGPAGLLLYLALRTAMKRGGFLIEDAV